MKKVEIDLKLYKKVEQIVKEKPEYGYIDVEEFVREAVRMSFRELDKLKSVLNKLL